MSTVILSCAKKFNIQRHPLCPFSCPSEGGPFLSQGWGWILLPDWSERRSLLGGGVGGCYGHCLISSRAFWDKDPGGQKI